MNAYEYIKSLFLELEESYNDWEPLQTSADVRAYVLLGRIYAEGHAIDNDPGKRHALVKLILKHPEVKETKKWSANAKPAEELLVTFLLGLKEKRSRKHNWLCALAYAKEQEVPPAADAFQNWIASSAVGGIEGAVDRYKGGTDEAQNIQIEDILAKLEEESPDAVTIDMAIADSAPNGSAVVIVGKIVEKQVKVLTTSIQESKIKRTLADLGLVKRPKKRTPIQVANVENSALRSLNRVTQKIAEGRKLGGKDALVFMGAVSRLRSVPELAEKHFVSHPRVMPKFGDKTKNESDVIPVANVSFHTFDPGRFISGAREGSLIPYAFDPADMAKTRLALMDFLKPPGLPEPEKYESDPMALVDQFVAEPEETTEHA